MAGTMAHRFCENYYPARPSRARFGCWREREPAAPGLGAGDRDQLADAHGVVGVLECKGARHAEMDVLVHLVIAAFRRVADGGLAAAEVFDTGARRLQPVVVAPARGAQRGG